MGRIVVLGSINVDLVVQVPKLPMPGHTVLGDRLRQLAGGKGANQAVAAARLGGDVSMVGRVGDDDFGAMLLDELRKSGVDTAAVCRDPEQPSGAALILVESGGQNTIAVAPGASSKVGEPDVSRALDRLDSGSSLVIQLEIPLAAVRSAIAGAARRGARTVLNAAPPTHLGAGLLKGLGVLVVNESEATEMFEIAVDDHESARRAAQAGAAFGVLLTVVTLGASGAVFCRGRDSAHVPGFVVDAVDSTGAGDAFVGALAVALDRGLGDLQSVRIANAAGAAAVLGYGAQSSLPTAEDLRRLFDVELTRSA